MIATPCLGQYGAVHLGRGRGVAIADLLIIIGFVNLILLIGVFVRRFLTHWRQSVQDEQRLLAETDVQQALEQLRRGQPPTRPRHRVATEEELIRLTGTAVAEERQLVQRLFHEWSFMKQRKRRLRWGPPWQRGYSAIVLGRMRAREALPDIVSLLEVGSSRLQLAAVRALDLLGDPRAVDPLAKILPSFRKTAWRLIWSALVNSAREEPERLLPHLSHRDGAVRAVVAAAAAEVATDKMAAKLAAFANDSDPEVRAKIARALGRTRDPVVLPPLIQMAQDPVWYVRLQAVGAMGRLSDTSAQAALEHAIRDSHLQVRQRATGALYDMVRDPIDMLDLVIRGPRDRYALGALIAELESRGTFWDAINQVNSPIGALRDLSHGLLRRLVEVGAYSSMLYAMEYHSDVGTRQALVELMARALPPQRLSDLQEMLAAPHLDLTMRDSIEKVVKFSQTLKEQP